MKENKRNGKTAESLETVHTSNSTKRTETIYSTSNSLKNKNGAMKYTVNRDSILNIAVVSFTVSGVCLYLYLAYHYHFLNYLF